NVLVLDRRGFPTDLDRGMPDCGGQWHRTLGHHGVQAAAGDRLDRSAQVLSQVDDVAAHVGEGTRARPATISPADRGARVASVVAPVVGAEVEQIAERAGVDLVANCTNGR